MRNLSLLFLTVTMIGIILGSILFTHLAAAAEHVSTNDAALVNAADTDDDY
jgi:hypothetical protein